MTRYRRFLLGGVARRRRVDEGPRWDDLMLWIAVGAVALMILVTLATEAACR